MYAQCVDNNGQQYGCRQWCLQLSVGHLRRFWHKCIVLWTYWHCPGARFQRQRRRQGWQLEHWPRWGNFGGGQQWWICCVDGYLGNQYINITIAHLLVWPYIQNFWSWNFRFLTPHCLIIRVKVHFECKLDYHFTCLLCLCKFYFCPTCLNNITALTMHCISRCNEFFPKRENRQ